MITKVFLTLGGTILLCASVIGGTGPLTVPPHATEWLPSISGLTHPAFLDGMSESGRLLLLGIGFVVLGRRVRRKSR
jgi:hypothetical protein